MNSDMYKLVELFNIVFILASCYVLGSVFSHYNIKLDYTRDKKLLLWYGVQRKFIVIWSQK